MSLKISIHPDQFEQLRADPAFILIIRLCRYLNQLLFCFRSYDDASNDKNSVGMRQMVNSLLFIAGIMYEAWKMREDLGKEFKDYKSFKNDLIPLWKNGIFHRLQENQLNRLRNQVVYHVDSHPYEEFLKDFTLKEYDFMKAEGASVLDAHFDLADNLSLNWVIGNRGDDEAEKREFERFATKLMDLTKNFIKAADSLIAEYASNKDWYISTEEAGDDLINEGVKV